MLLVHHCTQHSISRPPSNLKFCLHNVVCTNLSDAEAATFCIVSGAYDVKFSKGSGLIISCLPDRKNQSILICKNNEKNDCKL